MQSISNSNTSVNTAAVCNKYSQLSPEHQEHIAGRGLLDNNWTEMTCYTTSAKNATSVLGYPAKSGGIMFWGYNNQYQFRPDTPWESKDGECPKYRTPKGGYDALLLGHLTDDIYWKPDSLKEACWKINGHPCILLTEGGFKAIAGCSSGIPTVALLGVEMGLTGKDAEGNRQLVLTLKRYAEAGFGFIIAFDADAVTNPNIYKAEKTLALALKEYNVPVYTVTGHWNVEDGKGMDDFIQNKGIEEFRKILEKAVAFGDKADSDRKKEKPGLPGASAVAQEIAERYRDKLAWESEYQIWRHYGAKHDGMWSEATPESVKGLIHAHLRALPKCPDFSAGYVSSVATILQSDLEVQDWNEQDGSIPLMDGVLNRETKELKPHAPGYRFTWQLPYKWADRSIGCEPIEDFLVRIQVFDWGIREGMKKSQQWADIASRKKAIALLP